MKPKDNAGRNRVLNESRGLRKKETYPATGKIGINTENNRIGIKAKTNGGNDRERRDKSEKPGLKLLCLSTR